MVRQTSLEAYNAIMNEGLLGRMQREVYDVVFKYGPCTSAEGFDHMRLRKVYKNPLSQSRARFTELRDRGVFQEVGERVCRVTGRKAIVWDVTPNLPSAPPKTKKGRTYDEGYNQAIHDVMSLAHRVWLLPDDRFMKPLATMKKAP